MFRMAVENLYLQMDLLNRNISSLIYLGNAIEQWHASLFAINDISSKINHIQYNNSLLTN